ncbi:MAG: transcription termination/antitermination protein NusA [Clostridia bacterium]|nr:transcription termination/antitermination protein NusA [Clostridia bacterium]
MKKKQTKVNGPAIDSIELIFAMEELEKENGIKKEEMLETIETALVTAYKRNYDCEDENVKITMDKETGEIHVYMQKEVVKEVENEKTQISLEEAQKIDKKYKVGDIVENELVPKNFGRIAAGTAKQVIIQKIREASREFLYNEFNDKKGEIVSGIIQKADGGVVIVDLGRLEGVMPLKEQIITERYHVNDKIRACVVGVEKGLKGSTQVIISRSHNDFVRKLFELEIPEIYEGLIEIKSVSRDAGNRCKVAVYSPNENIDPVGSCVGQKGIRIQNIINELNGEKIDVIEWNEDPAIYISSALLPAQVMAVDVKEEEHFAQVIVPDDQLSLAIGKAGQNARLAARLTNWKIDIKSETQFREMIAKMQNEESENAETVEEIIEEAIPESDSTNEEITEEVEEITKKRGRKKKEEIVEEVEEEKVEEAPKKRGRKKKEEVIEEVKEEAVVEETPKKKTRKKKEEVEETEEEKVEEAPKKRGRKKKEE